MGVFITIGDRHFFVDIATLLTYTPQLFGEFYCHMSSPIAATITSPGAQNFDTILESLAAQQAAELQAASQGADTTPPPPPPTPSPVGGEAEDTVQPPKKAKRSYKKKEQPSTLPPIISE